MTIQANDDLVKDPMLKRKRRRGAKARTNTLVTSTNTKLSSKNSSAMQEESKPSDGANTDGNLNFDTCIKDKKKSQKAKSKKTRVKAPKPGEEGFLTPTQLRNARKRRAKQQKNNKNINGDPSSQSPSNLLSISNENVNDKPSSKKIHKNKCLDPSLQYIRNAAGAPIVESARQYFQDLLPEAKKFKVHLGPTKNWRTVSKLPVRAYSCSSQNNKKLGIGLFQPNSHEIIPITGGCRAHHPSIDLAVQAVTKACHKKMTSKKIVVQPYNEQDGTGHLRYIAINVERKTSKVQLTLVWNSEPYGDNGDNSNTDDVGQCLLNELVNELINKYGTVKGENDSEKKKSLRLHSLWVHFNAQWKHANSIFQYNNENGSNDKDKNSWILKYGPPHVEEVLLLKDDLKLCYSNDGMKSQSAKNHSREEARNLKEVKLYFPPFVFRQANMDAFSKIVMSIRKHLLLYIIQRNKNHKIDHKAGEYDDKSSQLPSCLELYGGVGTIGLNVHELVSSLTSSDENPHNRACFEKSVEYLSSAPNIQSNKCDKISYISKNATNMVTSEKSLLINKAEVLIVDPPRKGFDEKVTESLIALNNNLDQGPKLLIYVSCGFEAFQKDCSQLLNSGRWKLTHAEGHILFPGSDAIETLAIFSRIH